MPGASSAETELRTATAPAAAVGSSGVAVPPNAAGGTDAELEGAVDGGGGAEDEALDGALAVALVEASVDVGGG
jgi:hypothetical protein